MHSSEPGSSNSERLRVSVVAPVLAAFLGLSVMAALIAHRFHASKNEIPVSASDSAAEREVLHSRVPMAAMHSNAAVVIESVQHPTEPSFGVVASEETASGSKRYFPVEQVSELDDLISGSLPETEKLGVALASLESPDKKIRRAALEAVRGLDDREAVTRLQELAAQSDDADEKTALLDTANFLNLPSFTSDSAGQSASVPVERTTAAQRLARSGILTRRRDASPASQP